MYQMILIAPEIGNPIIPYDYVYQLKIYRAQNWRNNRGICTQIPQAKNRNSTSFQQ